MCPLNINLKHCIFAVLLFLLLNLTSVVKYDCLIGRLYRDKIKIEGEKNMISMNLKFLRGKFGFSQEELAEKIGVSRQSVAKWENGESLPDIKKCSELSQVYGVSIDALVNCPFDEQEVDENSSDGKYVFGIVKVGERGQVVIPKQARTVYEISSGDKLLVVGDSRGMAFAKINGLSDLHFVK